MKLTYILKQLLEEEKKKADRCLRIARRKFDKSSAYRSGAIVRCRQGKIWKGLKEEQNPSEELFNQAIQDIKPIIPLISHDIIHDKNLEHNEENMVKINKELLKRVYAGDDYILDRLWDLAGNSLLKNAVNIITAYVNNKITETIKKLIQEDESLHKWFKRSGTPGKEGGWVDCNTCRNGKCKSCGRKEGEKRAKYPSCRPTPAQCKTKGKGKKWGKTK